MDGNVRVRKTQLSSEELEVLKEKAARADALWDQYLRLQAEFENTRKRFLKEKEEYVLFAHGALVQELLPIYDHFLIALSNLQNASETGNHGAVLQGIRMIQSELWELLDRNGLSRIETVGKPFNPDQHEAVETVEDEAKPEGTVAAEIRPGYLLHGKLLRPASVKVTTKKKMDENQNA